MINIILNMSQFLPNNIDSTKPIAVIAGKGDYPVQTVQKIRERGLPVRLIAFADETKPELVNSFDKSERAIIKVGQLGHMLKSLQKLNAGYAIMAGQITPRRLFKGLHPDLKAIKILASLKERNAESIFGAIANEIEAIGIQQLDARAFLDDYIVEAGTLVKGKCEITPETLEHGIHIAKEVARLNIGQGVVVSNGTVLEVEGFEGTDEMLRRASGFGAKNILFVKTVKPKQDYRFDVPVFGMQTLDTMLEAGIGAVALEANNTILLDKQAVFQKAKKKKIHILGY